MTRWRGRPESTNIVDNRAYFGSESVDPGYFVDDRNQDFLNESLLSPYLSGPKQSFGGNGALTIEDILALIDAVRAGKSPRANLGSSGVFDRVNSGILRP